MDPEAERFRVFAEEVGDRLERALIAAYGLEVGSEAFAEAMGVAWERWAEVSAMVNPVGFLYRVGQSRARPHVRWWSRRRSFAESFQPEVAIAEVDDGLLDAFALLGRLRREQRVAVLMVRAWGFTYAETAETLGVSEAAAANHVRRGMALLRQGVGVIDDDDR